MNARVLASCLALVLGGCGDGVPITLLVDDFTFDLSIDDAMENLEAQLTSNGVIPPGTNIPERWPAELPDVCYDFFARTNPDDGGRIDLTPDPDKDPDLAQKLKPVNDGLIDRIELNDLIIRVEQNDLNVPLPPIEVQAADEYDADAEDRRAWRTVGALGGDGISPGCAVTANQRENAVEPGELLDLPFTWARSGESFLDNQLADENCVMRQQADGGPASRMKCKEFALRARTRLTLDTKVSRARPRGTAKLRLILIGTFYVTPF